jgi:phage tail-like protein
MPDANRTDPFLNFHFRLSLDGQPWASFAECTGLSLELATEEYAEGGENRFAYKLPTRAAPANLVLKRGITESAALWDWFIQFVEQGTLQLRDGQIELLAAPDTTRPVRAWKFTAAYPVKWTGPELNAASAGVAFETLELVHQGIRLV